MGAGSSKPSEREVAKSHRKCASYVSGLEGCRRANAGPDTDKICKNLHVKVVSCYAEEFAPNEAVEHRK
jgi:hypothetical protein